MQQTPTPLAYIYDDLEEQLPNSIRLLSVYRGTSDYIQCGLKRAVLDETLRFYALSYTWGAGDRDKTILIDDKAFPIRPNLWTLLKRLQTSSDATLIWIDAICVNQDNIPERNQQVRLMSQIYSQADTVLIWLGDDPSGVCGVLATEKFPKETHRWVRRVCNVLESETLPRECYKRLRQVRKIWWKGGRPVKAAIKDISERPYWNRVWVIQEYSLARRIVIWFDVAGNLSAEALNKWLEYWREEMDYSLAFNSFADRMQRPNRRRRMVDLIQWYQEAECSDPRDRLYALLGLADDRDDMQIEIDYSITMDELCAKVKRALPTGDSMYGDAESSTAYRMIRYLERKRDDDRFD